MFKLTESHKDLNSFKIGIKISNPHESYDTTKHCVLNIALGYISWWFEVPQLFKPKREWVDTTNLLKDSSKSSGYYNLISKSYGFMLYSDALHIDYGIQPGRWSSEDKKNSDHSKCYFIPWNNTRRVAYNFQDEYGNIVAKANDKNHRLDMDSIENGRNKAPKYYFSFKDFDGEENKATCHIEYMKWRYGTGLFKWVGFIRKPIVQRTLVINFEKEVGRQKGSWKGGLIGTSTKIDYGQTPLDAFIKFGNEMTREKPHGLVNRNFTEIKQL